MINPYLVAQYAKVFPAGTVVFKEGEIGEDVFLIESGEIRIKRTVMGQEILFAHLGPGELFGEMSYLTKERRSATAEATKESRILVIPGEGFAAILRNHPKLTFDLFTALVRRLQETDRHLEIFSISGPLERVVHYLAEGSAEALPFRDACAFLAMPPEALEAALVRLTEWGVVSVSKGMVSVLKKHDLLHYQKLLELRKRHEQDKPG
ncbi:MAG: Crp/Fnr family transcriptional regulator [Armatimonadetes bacterium]|nr:Crp/Fnr family transcriptional regulator [Armatimonadota bacterium]